LKYSNRIVVKESSMVNTRKLITLVLGVMPLVLVLVGCAGTGTQTGEKATGTATINGNSQIATTEVGPNFYTPITVQKGMPVRWTVKADEANLSGCNNEIIVPELGIQRRLQPGDTLIEFTPQSTGVIPFSCWMGMIHGQINVVDKLPTN
jgi:plastocyanin domain-containing protein